MRYPATERRLWPSEHPRQPYAPWCSIRRDSFQWFAARFFRAPVPSGCTLIVVESKDAASSWMRTICSICNFSNTRSSTPVLDHQLIRMWIVCQRSDHLGSPRHLQSCSATHSTALSTCRLLRFTFPRCTGRLPCFVCAVLLSVPSASTDYPESSP